MKKNHEQRPQGPEEPPNEAPPPVAESQPEPKEQGPKTYEVTKGVEPEAVVIYCGQPDLQQAFQDFIEGKLGLAKGQYIPFVVAGGAGALSRPMALPKEFKFMKERIELFREHFKSLKRVILINHENCAYYKNLSDKLGSALPFHNHLSREDMKLAANAFARLLSHLGLQLELYYAKYANDDHTQVTFERVE